MRRIYLPICLVTLGCINEPVYLPSPNNMEAGVEKNADGKPIPAKASLKIPIVTETAKDEQKREALKAKYPDIDVPYVRIGDLEISVEWTIRNLTGEDSHARIGVNGANESWAYDPDLLELGEADNVPIVAPDLRGDIPLAVPAYGDISGVFTEDDMREATVDLDMITRGNVHPFHATLEVNKNVTSFEERTPGIKVPREAMAQLVRVDLVFKPDSHMVLDYTVRVRDVRHNLLHKLGFDAWDEADDELAFFDPTPFTIPDAAPTTP